MLLFRGLGMLFQNPKHNSMLAYGMTVTSFMVYLEPFWE
jgi:hypothetical protein